MFVDASALTAMLTDEQEAGALLARLQTDPRRMTSPLAVWETAIAVARVLALPLDEATEAVARFLDLIGVDVAAVPPEAAAIALDAHARYGKGRHPARLNFGDCFAYACARHHRQKLLFKGLDFALTDIEPA